MDIEVDQLLYNVLEKVFEAGRTAKTNNELWQGILDNADLRDNHVLCYETLEDYLKSAGITVNIK